MKKVLFIFAGLFICYALSGQSAMPFLRIGGNPVSMALGGTEMSDPLYNPSEAVMQENSLAGVSYVLWAPGTFKQSHINASGAVGIGDKLSVVAGARFFAHQPYPVIDISGNVTSKDFTPSDLVFGLGAGYKITDNISLGIKANYGSQKISEKKTFGAVFADLFVSWTKDCFGASLGLLTLGPKVEGYSLPSSVSAGCHYLFSFAGNSTVLAVSDFDYFFSGGVSFSAGAQYAFNEKYFARAGVKLSSSSAPVPTHLSLGAGAKFAGASLNLTYLLANSIIGNSLCAGVSYEF